MDYAITIIFNTSEITALTQTRGGGGFEPGTQWVEEEERPRHQDNPPLAVHN